MNQRTYLENACSIESKTAPYKRGLGSSSLASVRALVSSCALFAISLWFLLMAPLALAATWPVSTSALSASVAFHESYSAGNGSYVHSGIDIPASAGMQISAPLAGTVRFTGTVPSGDSRIIGGATQTTMNVVTIELTGGNTITLMPFATIAVKEGQIVSEGAALGSLAAFGDISSGASHLHMGYKQGSQYLDPMSLFGVVSSASQDSVPGTLKAPHATGIAGVASAQGAAVAETSSSAAGQSLGERDALSSAALAGAPEVGTIESSALAYRPKQQSVASPFAGIAEAGESLLAACQLQFDALMEAARGFAQALDAPLPVILCGTAVIVGVIAVSLFRGCAKLLGSRLQKMLQTRKCGTSWQSG